MRLSPTRRLRPLTIALSGAVLVLAATALAVRPGFAANIGGVTSRNLGAANTTVAGCDGDGVSVSFVNTFNTTTGGYEVTSITVSAIATTCVGQTLNVTVRNAALAPLWSGSATVAGTSATLTPTPIASTGVAGWAVSITG